MLKKPGGGVVGGDEHAVNSNTAHSGTADSGRNKVFLEVKKMDVIRSTDGRCARTCDTS
jgi:hypothetical protein